MAIISGGKGIRPQGTALPIIINGDMAVSQRTTSFAAVGDGVYTLERDDNGNLSKDLAVFSPNQIQILGSKQDIKGFKDFVSKYSKTI